MELAAAGQLGGAGAPVEDADMPVMRSFNSVSFFYIF